MQPTKKDPTIPDPCQACRIRNRMGDLEGHTMTYARFPLGPMCTIDLRANFFLFIYLFICFILFLIIVKLRWMVDTWDQSKKKKKNDGCGMVIIMMIEVKTTRGGKRKTHSHSVIHARRWRHFRKEEAFLPIEIELITYHSSRPSF